MSILEEITARRRIRIQNEGHTQGERVPEERKMPLIPLGAHGTGGEDPFLICELKRRSPSKGELSNGLDVLEQAGTYIRAGVRNISVLTEQDHFAGSLRDLMKVKNRFPEASVLRKDFLMDPEDIQVSFRAGADAVLLIASLLDENTLDLLYSKAKDLGMEVLFELHDEEDLRKARRVQPTLTGINSRNLSTFRVDLVSPLELKGMIDWPTRMVFESGIKFQEHLVLALSAGFRGALVGEAVIKDPDLVGNLIESLSSPLVSRVFWPRLFLKKRRPLIKVCGLTRADDAHLAAQLGADLLGFIFAPSKRRADPILLRDLTGLDALKVGVVVQETEELDSTVLELLSEGLLDAVQFHGDEKPQECFSLAFPYYKAVQVANRQDVMGLKEYRCPRILIDAYSPKARGGTGVRVADEYVKMVKERQPLWLAGGIGPENVGRIVRDYRPELVDSSSGLESEPGRKDAEAMRRFFREIECEAPHK